MLRVKTGDLQEGMIIAEPIMDVTGKILLEAKAQLTKTNIEILKTWDIAFIRIREAGDTDSSIERELSAERAKAGKPSAGAALDRQIEQKIGINEQGILNILKGDIFGKAADWTADRGDAGDFGTLATVEGVKYYYKFLDIIVKLLETNTREKEFSIKEINEISRIVTEYVMTTPGVIGYALRPAQGTGNELARHILSTTVIAGKIAMLLNYNAKEINNLVLATLLHDIGKLGLPGHVANQSRRLSVEEEKLYQSHVSLGLARIKGRSWIPKEVLLAVAQHHERMDGKGFPMGFTGDKIHPYAKIIAIADYFDNNIRKLGGDTADLPEFINKLPYMTSQFDAGICEIFKAYLKDFLMSNIIELEDGRKAQIIYMHQAFAEPVIRTHDGEFIDLNTCSDIKIEKYSI